MFFFLPETFEATILLRRARRLRKLTGNRKLKSAGEIEQGQTSITQILIAALYRPLRLSLEPAVAFANVRNHIMQSQTLTLPLFRYTSV